MIPIIHMDYACLSEKRLFRLSELSEEDREHLPHFLIYPDAPSHQQSERQAVTYVIDRYTNPLQNVMIKKRRAAPCPPRGSR